MCIKQIFLASSFSHLLLWFCPPLLYLYTPTHQVLTLSGSVTATVVPEEVGGE